MTQVILTSEVPTVTELPTEQILPVDLESGPSGTIRGQGSRFLLIGSAGTALQLGLFAASSEFLGAQPASVASWLVSTLVTNAVHRGFTFGVRGGQQNRSDQLVALLTCLVGLMITSVVLARLPDADGVAGLVAILAVNTLVGAARFGGMRWWLGTSGRHFSRRVIQARVDWRADRALSGLHH